MHRFLSDSQRYDSNLLTTPGFVSPIDATCVKRLREGGAIVTGKVNLDEFGMG